MAALGLFAVHKCIACHHFKQSATRRDHLEAFNCRREVLQQIGRRTDGSGCVVSLYTVFDTDLVLLHSSLLSLVGLSAQQMKYTAGGILAASLLFVKPGAGAGVQPKLGASFRLPLGNYTETCHPFLLITPNPDCTPGAVLAGRRFGGIGTGVWGGASGAREGEGGVYSRVCGGTMPTIGYAMRSRGLSPRVRGNRSTVKAMRPFYRSIPACAGEPDHGDR